MQKKKRIGKKKEKKMIDAAVFRMATMSFILPYTDLNILFFKKNSNSLKAWNITKNDYV